MPESGASQSSRSLDSGDWYATLGVVPAATAEEIRAAFLKASQTWRQRKSAATDPVVRFEAEQMEQRVREARDVLLDPAKRLEFDRSRQAEVALPAGQGDRGAVAPEGLPEGTRRCPYCDELIRQAARKCKHCGEFLVESIEVGQSASSRPAPPVADRPGGQASVPESARVEAASVAGPRAPSGPREPAAGDVRTFGGMAFCYIPPGSFDMGSPADEEGRFGNEVRHRVILTRGFWLKQTPVTNAEWERAMGKAAPSRFKGDDRPVERVSWQEAVAFCNALSRQEGITEVYRDVSGAVRWDDPDARGYRLPTEAEWEYACRAGNAGARYGPLGDIAWYRSNSGGETHPVGQKFPNPWGLKDMLGNVWEWTWDWYGQYPDQTVDPRGPEKGSFRVFRGGSWNYNAQNARAASRDDDDPGDRRISLGFRLARSRP